MPKIALLLLLLSEPTAPVLLRAENALARNSHGEARKAFLQARTEALANGDRDVAWRSTFYLGLTSELLAEVAADPAPLLSEAATYYEEAQRLNATPGVWNNLAGVRAKQQKHAEAQALYRKAIEARDDHQSFYEQNYASYLRTIGKDREALAYYRRAVREQTPADEVHEEIVSLALRTAPGELAEYLSDILERGMVAQVTTAAVRALGDAKAVSVHDELVAILARSLSQTSHAAAASLPASLRATRHPGAIELAALYDARPTVDRFSWWTRGDVAALQAFLALSHTIGREFERRKRPEAEYYYRIAAEAGAASNVQSVIDLASYYATVGKDAELERVSRTYESLIVSQNAWAYHAALGAIHAKRGIWKRAANANSGAIYHLERAEAARKELNARNPSTPLLPQGGFLMLLADGYAATGQTANANRIRREAAAAFSLSGDKESAGEAMASITVDPAMLDVSPVLPPQFLAANTPTLETRQQLRNALRNDREKGDLHGEALTLLQLGIVEVGLGNVDGARSSLAEAAKKMRVQNDPLGTWLPLIVLSQIEVALGRPAEAIPHFEEAFTVIKEARISTAPFSLKTLTAVGSASGFSPQTLRMVDDSNGGMMKPLMLQYLLEPMTHDLYGSVLTQIGMFEEAEAELNAAVGGSALSRGMHDFSIESHFGDLRFRQQRYGEARAHYLKALNASKATMLVMADSQTQASIYGRLARLEAITGNPEEAKRWSEKAQELSKKRTE